MSGVSQPAAGPAGLVARAELTKLARALGLPPSRVEFLARLPVEDLRRLRAAVSAALFDRHRAGFQRMAAASRLLPIGVLARIAEATMPPMLAARIAAEMSPERAAELATKLGTDYLADVCVELDPRRATPIVAALPLPVVVAVAGELVRRDEYLTIGRFVDAASDAVISAVLDALMGDEPLLRIAFYVESPDQLARVVGLLPDARLRGVVLAGVGGSPELQAAGLSLISRSGAALAPRLADLAAEADAADLTRLLDTAVATGTVAELTDVVSRMSEPARRRIAELAATSPDPQLRARSDTP